MLDKVKQHYIQSTGTEKQTLLVLEKFLKPLISTQFLFYLSTRRCHVSIVMCPLLRVQCGCLAVDHTNFVVFHPLTSFETPCIQRFLRFFGLRTKNPQRIPVFVVGVVKMLTQSSTISRISVFSQKKTNNPFGSLTVFR